MNYTWMGNGYAWDFFLVSRRLDFASRLNSVGPQPWGMQEGRNSRPLHKLASQSASVPGVCFLNAGTQLTPTQPNPITTPRRSRSACRLAPSCSAAPSTPPCSAGGSSPR